MSIKSLAAVAAAMTALAVAAIPASAECFVKAAEGTGGTKEAAQFQVDEALLQATDWGAWAAWMANGSTPGYQFGARQYKCSAGGLGFNCKGQAKICKL